MPEPALRAGWYPDPSSDRHWRWWDGASWTQSTAPRWSPIEIDESRIRPRAWAFALAAIPALAGIAAALVLVIGAIGAGTRTIDRFTAPLIHFTAPGSASVRLNAGEEQTIYATGAGSHGAAAPNSGDLSCAVRGPDGRSAALSANENVTLRQGAARYRSLYDFTAPTAGTTRIRCRPVPKALGPLELAIGPRFAVAEVLGIVLRVLGALAALFLGFGLGVGVGVLVGVLRDRSKRSLQADAAQKPPPDAPPAGA
jgi:Protein of unknown function (DUF2510)